MDSEHGREKGVHGLGKSAVEEVMDSPDVVDEVPEEEEERKHVVVADDAWRATHHHGGDGSASETAENSGDERLQPVDWLTL